MLKKKKKKKREKQKEVLKRKLKRVKELIVCDVEECRNGREPLKMEDFRERKSEFMRKRVFELRGLSYLSLYLEELDRPLWFLFHSSPVTVTVTVCGFCFCFFWLNWAVSFFLFLRNFVTPLFL